MTLQYVCAESVAYWAPERHSGTQNAATHIYSFGCLMWNLWVTQESQVGLGCKPHPQMGHFPASTPLSYVMLATACLSLKPEDRPSASGLLQVCYLLLVQSPHPCFCCLVLYTTQDQAWCSCEYCQPLVCVQDLNGLQRELRRHYTDLCGASQVPLNLKKENPLLRSLCLHFFAHISHYPLSSFSCLSLCEAQYYSIPQPQNSVDLL